METLHSVRFRNTGFKRTSVLSPTAEKLFTRFLIDSLGYNVFVISTALGLDVYYSNETSKTDFIVNNIWLFQEKEEKPKILIVQEHHNLDVLIYFNSIVDSLLKHPHLFLSTCKKFRRQYNTNSVRSRLILLLYTVFESHLEELITDNKVPFINQVKKILNEVQKPNYTGDSIVNNLGKVYLKQKNLN